MSDPTTLRSLISVRTSTSHSSTVPRPRSRWVLRFALPITILVAAMTVLAYAARHTFTSVMDVEVVVVITRQQAVSETDADHIALRSARNSQHILAQAPGWIEPMPFAITVQAMIAGVVAEVLVLEGDHVGAGDALVRLDSRDAELEVMLRAAEHESLKAELARAKAHVSAAEARVAERRDEYERKLSLIEVGGVAEGEIVRLRHQLRHAESDLLANRADEQRADSRIALHQIAIQQAQLQLERTVVHAPVSGVVLTRSATPGTRIALAGDGVGEAHYPGLLTIYNPTQLQVRADVPLTDAASIGIGTHALITTEALPDQVFQGEVVRIMHKADIQRNTLQFKVHIHDPSSSLKPDMLARVRFVNRAQSTDPSAGAGNPATGESSVSLRVYVPRESIYQLNEDHGIAWVVEPGARDRSLRAVRREVVLGDSGESGLTHVLSGLRPGDRVIVNAPVTIQSGTLVRVRPVKEDQ